MAISFLFGWPLSSRMLRETSKCLGKRLLEKEKLIGRIEDRSVLARSATPEIFIQKIARNVLIYTGRLSNMSP